MITVRTPLRISLAGGGSDLPYHCSQHGGHTITTAIDKFVYVSITERYDGPSLIHYRETETMRVGPGEINHPIVREVLTRYPLKHPFEIVTTADIGGNSGLGSSSAFAVALLHAVWTARGEARRHGRKLLASLAEEAYAIEAGALGAVMGKQDAYACALGGLLECEYAADGGIEAKHIFYPRNDVLSGLLLFDTDIRRQAAPMLQAQAVAKPSMSATMADVTRLKLMLSGHSTEPYGTMLREHWARKRVSVEGMSDPKIDRAIEAIEGRRCGAKLVGAGGGGFILASVPNPEKHSYQVIGDMRELGFRHVPFQPSTCSGYIHGSKVLLDTRARGDE